MENTKFKNVEIQPAAGDGYGAMGAALYAYYNQTSRNANGYKHSTLLDPEYTDAEIESYLKSRKAIYTKYSEAKILKKTAELIKKNQITGWFQGRMEYGPRALGNRSILANACNPEMKDILNARAKFREDFRPFAPAIMADRANEYFKIGFESPYMLFVAPDQDRFTTEFIYPH